MSETPDEPQTPEIPEAPVEADAAGTPEGASTVEVGEGERPAPPARARDPEPEGPGAPEVRPLGQGEPVAEPEEAFEDSPRAKPEIPGADLVPDIVLEGDDPLGLLEGRQEEEVFRPEEPVIPEPPPEPERPERPEPARRPLPRPGLAGGESR